MQYLALGKVTTYITIDAHNNSTTTQDGDFHINLQYLANLQAGAPPCLEI
jgi:hypothetical protein